MRWQKHGLMSAENDFSVFVVDDSDPYRTLLVESLEKMDLGSYPFRCKVYTYSSGEECLENIDKNPDVLVLDYHLDSNGYSQNMNGMNVLKQVHEKSPSTVVVMLSCQKNDEVTDALLRAGVFAYITKGQMSVFEIRDTITSLMEKRMAKQKNKFA